MERRFKLVGISIDVVASHSKGFEQALLKALPKGSSIVMKKDDIYAATLFLLIHNSEFPILEDKTIPPNITVTLKHKKATPILTFDS
jgi:hypothetical protein